MQIELLNKTQKQMLETLKVAGVPITPEIEEEILALSPRTQPKSRARDTTDTANMASRQAELLLLSLDRPITEVKSSARKCKECNETFLADYNSVRYCSDDCRAAWLHKIGIEYDWTKPYGDRFAFRIGDRPPAVIPPADLKRLRVWAEWLLSFSLDQECPEPSTAPSKVSPSLIDIPDLL